MLQACGLWGRTLLAAGLAALLLSLAGNPLPHNGQFWKLLFLASVLYALFKSLGVLVRSKPDTQQHRTHTIVSRQVRCLWCPSDQVLIRWVQFLLLIFRLGLNWWTGAAVGSALRYLYAGPLEGTGSQHTTAHDLPLVDLD